MIPFASVVVQSSFLALISKLLVPIFRLLTVFLVRLILVLSYIIFLGLNLFFLMLQIY